MEALYMSPAEAAKRYGICRKIIYELISMSESPPTLKIGNRRLIPIAQWDEFIKKQFETKHGG